MKQHIIKVGNYFIPVMSTINAFTVVGTDAKIGWAVAALGWFAHLIEVRKNGN